MGRVPEVLLLSLSGTEDTLSAWLLLFLPLKQPVCKIMRKIHIEEHLLSSSLNHHVREWKLAENRQWADLEIKQPYFIFTYFNSVSTQMLEPVEDISLYSNLWPSRTWREPTTNMERDCLHRHCIHRTRGDGFKLKEGRFSLDVWKKFFSLEMMRSFHYPSLLGEAVAALYLEVFMSWLDGA